MPSSGLIYNLQCIYKYLEVSGEAIQLETVGHLATTHGRARRPVGRSTARLHGLLTLASC